MSKDKRKPWELQQQRENRAYMREWAKQYLARIEAARAAMAATIPEPQQDADEEERP